MSDYRKKPLEGESIYKHVMMLAGYCYTGSQAGDTTKRKKKALSKMAAKLYKMSNSPLMVELQVLSE